MKKSKLFISLIFTIALVVGAGVCIALDVNPSASLGFASILGGVASLATVAPIVLPLEEKEMAKAIENYLNRANDEIKNVGKVSTETKSAMDNLLNKMTEIELKSAKVGELEGKAAKMQEALDTMAIELKKAQTNMNAQERKTFASEFQKQYAEAKSRIQNVVEGRSKSDSITIQASLLERKDAITMLTTNTQTGDVLGSYRKPGIVYDIFEDVRIRDLIGGAMPVSMGSVSYIKDKSVTNGVAIQTEGSAKGISSSLFELVTNTCVTVATTAKVSEQLLMDMPMLTAYLVDKYTGQLKDKEDSYILYDGTDSMFNAATAWTKQKALSTIQEIDVILNAVTQIRKSNGKAAYVLVNPTDLLAIRWLKEATTNQYLFPPEVRIGGMYPNIGGCMIIDHNSVTADDFFVFDRRGVQMYDRMSTNVVFDRSGDDLEKNLMSMRIEERVLITVERPALVVYGTFTASKANGSA